MKPPGAELQVLVRDWVRKSAQDFAGAERLAAEGANSGNSWCSMPSKRLRST